MIPATSSKSGNRRSPQENPSYAEDALDAHLRVLLRWAERSRDAADVASPEEDVYLWWAKIRSPRREGELPHAGEIAAIQSQIDDDVETHLYLTDYRSLPHESRPFRILSRRAIPRTSPGAHCKPDRRLAILEGVRCRSYQRGGTGHSP